MQPVVSRSAAARVLCIWLFAVIGIASGISLPNFNLKSTQRDIASSLSTLCQSDLSVLLVLDPNWQLCFEEVDVDDFAKGGLLPWVAGLRDALTIHPAKPEGDFLKIKASTAAPELGRFSTYREAIEDVLSGGNTTVQLPSMLLLLYELSMVDMLLAPAGSRAAAACKLRLDQLKVTTPGNFWPVVELTAVHGALTAPALQEMNEVQAYNMKYPPSEHDEYLPNPAFLEEPPPTRSTLGTVPTVSLASIEGAVIILPQIVPALRNNGVRRPVTGAHRDPFDWDLPRLRDMLSGFFAVSGTTSLPPLEEHTTLPDKATQMFLQRAYEDYHARDPTARVPPIPTVEVRVPGTPRENALLCYTKEKYAASDSHIDANMKAIYHALLKLHALMPPDSDIQLVQEQNQDTKERAYILKRNLSNAATHVLTLRVPDRMLQHGCLLGSTDGQPCTEGGMQPWRAGPIMSLSDDLSTGAVTTPMYLRKAAETLARESCGEPWLLQPKIEDMETLEYRVYLLGGAEATGNPNDTIVYYVAGDVDQSDADNRRGLGALAYMTIMPDYFWSDSLYPPGYSSWEEFAASQARKNKAVEEGSTAGQCSSGSLEGRCANTDLLGSAGKAAQRGGNSTEHEEQVRRLWHAPELYDTLVQAALDNVRAVAASNLTDPSVANLFARADVVLAYYTDDEDTHLVPLINEISLLNSASKLIDFWHAPRDSPNWPPELKAQYALGKNRSTEDEVRNSWGFTLAKIFAREVVKKFLTDLHGARDIWVSAR